jgi:hypothetical protein
MIHPLQEILSLFPLIPTLPWATENEVTSDDDYDVARANEVIALDLLINAPDKVNAPNIHADPDISEQFKQGIEEGLSAAVALLSGATAQDVISNMDICGASFADYVDDFDDEDDDSPLTLKQVVEAAAAMAMDEGESEVPYDEQALYEEDDDEGDDDDDEGDDDNAAISKAWATDKQWYGSLVEKQVAQFILSN